MNTKENSVKNSSLLKRIRERLSTLNISELVRAFQRMLLCGKGNGGVKERYLTNEEISCQLSILQQRFDTQTLRFNEFSQRRAGKMTKAARDSTEQFKRIEALVEALQEKRKIELEV